MIKLFVTGDVHIGKKYNRYPEIKDQLINSRFECLERCVKEAEKEQCDFFVITGDLFDNINSIRIHDITRIVQILSQFGGTVLVLPGNHDYYTGEEKVWKDFKNALMKYDNNIILITDFSELHFDIQEETVTFYPAFCQSKHGTENNLGWIRKQGLDEATYHVGIAHGALEGLTPDLKNEYFLMTEKELNEIPMDVWLIGHTHIPYPQIPAGMKDVMNYSIFNAGTPEQTDLSNNTIGQCFIISLNRNDNKTLVSAGSYQSGAIRYFDLSVQITDNDLRVSIISSIKDLPGNSIIRLSLKGTIPTEQYVERNQIYEELLYRFMTYEVDDSELSELITREKIRSEFAEIGFAAELLEALQDSKEIQMAYELIKKHQS